jgi:hypothetical protein
MVNLKSKLAVRVHRESDQLERLAEEGDGLEMQPKLPDKRKAALADKLVKLKLNILDIKVMSATKQLKLKIKISKQDKQIFNRCCEI